MWDVYGGKEGTDILPHTHDVLAIAHRPDGKQLAVATLTGDIWLWNPSEAVLQVGYMGLHGARGHLAVELKESIFPGGLHGA